MFKTDEIETRKTFTIFSQRLAGTLMVKGFVLAGMKRKNGEATDKNVFYFYDSIELQKAIQEYIKRK